MTESRMNEVTNIYHEKACQIGLSAYLKIGIPQQGFST